LFIKLLLFEEMQTCLDIVRKILVQSVFAVLYLRNKCTENILETVQVLLRNQRSQSEHWPVTLSHQRLAQWFPNLFEPLLKS